MRAKEFEQKAMRMDMVAVMEQLRDAGRYVSDADAMRLKRIRESGRFREFGLFYKTAKRVMTEVCLKGLEAEEKNLEKGLAEIKCKELEACQKFKNEELGRGGRVEQNRQQHREDLQEKHDQRENDHRQKLAGIEEKHNQVTKVLWTDAEQDLKLLEEQITLFSLRLETEPLSGRDPGSLDDLLGASSKILKNEKTD